MSDQPPVDLALISLQQRQLLDEVRTMREDLNVLTAIVLRQDATMTALLNEMRAVHTQHARFGNRLRAVEERMP